MKHRMKIKQFSLLLVTVLLVTLALPGCGIDNLDLLAEPQQNVQNVEDGMIPGRRTGIIRQGISGQFKSYECTDNMAYFMVNANGAGMLYALEHDSDQMVPLCGASGCTHDDPACGAWFGGNGNICYYDDALFVNVGTKLYRMNPDGSGRTLILDAKDTADRKLVGFNGIAEPKLWNGLFTFYLTTYTEDPEHPLWDECIRKQGRYVPYYYRLDGSMDLPREMTACKDENGGDLIAQYNDGDRFIMRGPGLPEKADEYHLYTWNPNTNSETWFANVTGIMGKDYEVTAPVTAAVQDQYWHVLRGRRYEAYGEGYWGAKNAFYLETQENGAQVTNNILCRLNYANSKGEPLLDTGLEGNYRLCCFPDCFVLIETMNNAKQVPEAPAIRIYGWDMKLLGSGTLNYERGVLPQNLICGETANRIYLAGYFTGVPQYYIEKEALNGEGISLHELKYENLDLVTAYNEWSTIRDDSFQLWQDLTQKAYAAFNSPGEKMTQGPLVRSPEEYEDWFTLVDHSAP